MLSPVSRQFISLTVKRSRSDKNGKIKNLLLKCDKDEGAHATLKKCLQSSMGNLESVYQKIILQVKSQTKEIRAMISSKHMQIPHPVDSSNADLQLLLQSLAQQYHFWPPHQQAAAYAQLKELEHISSIVLKDPIITKSRRRPIGAKN
ncbi:10523_t:CDS:2 [Cetraspora pellucida]|uniref:10523_t:CDS:1 n=1 Tax=Cetraspora pellucida TaxID=1433469 RepID=A0A9N8VKA7_9GLOM|nr:10523_t:CDS:2 [Cetraspora pellucida]